MCMKSAGAHAEVVTSITEMYQVRMEDPDEHTLIQSWMCSDMAGSFTLLGIELYVPHSFVRLFQHSHMSQD